VIAIAIWPERLAVAAGFVVQTLPENPTDGTLV
jgi:hypothetical protein